MESAGKQVTLAITVSNKVRDKRGKTCNWLQARENMLPVASAGKRVTSGKLACEYSRLSFTPGQRHQYGIFGRESQTSLFAFRT